jgi:hypothetical protein
MTALLAILLLAVALVLGLAMAYVPMRLLMATMARNVKQLIQRTRDRRASSREGPERRKAPDPLP